MACIPYVVFKLKLISPQRYADTIFCWCLKGISPHNLDVLIQKWVLEDLPFRLRRPAKGLVHALKDNGYTPVLLSANFDILVHPIGRELGISESICTTTCIGNSSNRRAVSKVVRGIQKKVEIIARFDIEILRNSIGVGNEPADMAFLSALGGGSLIHGDDDLQKIIDTLSTVPTVPHLHN